MNEIPHRTRSLGIATCPTAKNSRRKAPGLFRGTPYLVFSIAAMCAIHTANAANQTWNGSISGDWSTPNNWAAGAAPGATSGVTNTDYATFNTAVSNTTVTIDSYLNLAGFTFTGAPGNYSIGSTSGSSVYLTSGGTSQITSGLTNTSTVVETINAPLVLSGGYNLFNSAANGAGAGSATFVIAGSITTAANSGTSSLNLRGSNTNANTISGTISDGAHAVFAVSKMDQGTWVLSGANTYTGKTSILVGTLSINTIADTGVSSAIGAGSTIIFGQNLSNSNTGTLLYTGATASSNRTIVITNGANGVAGGVINVSSAATTLTLSGAITVASNAYASTLTLKGSGNGVLSGDILNVGAMSFVKSDTGTWTLSGSNTSTGSITVNAGTVQIGNGSTTGGIDSISAVSGSNGATLAFDRSDSISYGGVISGSLAVKQIGTGSLIFTGANTYTGRTTISSGTLQLGNGDTTGSLAAIGTIVDNGALVINRSNAVSQGTDFSSAAITGAGSFVQAGSGTTTLTAANTYTGATVISAGELDVNGSLSASSAVTIASGATLAGSGTVGGSVTGTNATINGNGLNLAATTLSGTSTLSGYNIASSVTVDSGTTTLTGTTQSTSALSVSAGATLNANGMIKGNATVSGLLKGNSIVTGNLALTSGTLSPGNSAGITTVGGNFTMDATSKLVAAVAGTVAGTSYDQLKVSGNVSLVGTLDLTTLSGLTLGDTITLIENTGSGTTSGYFSTIITNGSTYTLTSNSEYTFTVNGTEYLLSYSSNADGDGQYNDVTLTVVPEPSTWAMLVGGIGMLLGLRHRKLWALSTR